MQRVVRRVLIVGLILVAVFLAGGLSLAQRTSGQRLTSLGQPGPENLAKGAKPAERLREGTSIVAVKGQFRLTGDRYTFEAADNRKFRVLENLALERVSTIVDQSLDRRDWTVTGQATEYRGSNYLLLTRAIVRTQLEKSTPP